MDKEILEILDAVRQRGKEIIDLAEDRHTDIGYLSQKILAIAMVIEGMEDIIPISVYKQYSYTPVPLHILQKASVMTIYYPYFSIKIPCCRTVYRM